MFSGYDSGQVLREDILLRIQLLYDEIAASQKQMERVEKEAANIEEPLAKRSLLPSSLDTCPFHCLIA